LGSDEVMFKPGDHVVCKNAEDLSLKHTPLVLGGVYTVRRVEPGLRCNQRVWIDDRKDYHISSRFDLYTPEPQFPSLVDLVAHAKQGEPKPVIPFNPVPRMGPREDTPKVVSDGGATSYYDLPPSASTLNDLIEHKDMSFALGNIFKACYRFGEKHGNDAVYELNKIIYFAERLKALHQKEAT
jgi:hypothetical protein